MVPSLAELVPAADHLLGNSVGAIGWPQVSLKPSFGSLPGSGLTSVFLLPLNYSILSEGFPGVLGHLGQDSYLVDSASSHMLVSKIKPCMSKYKQLYRETANGSMGRSFTGGDT